jgi:hypothetical protein
MKTKLFLLIMALMPLSILAQKTTISVNIPTATIKINGRVAGTGIVNKIKIPKGDCVTVEVENDAYIPQKFDLCNQPLMPKIENTTYVELEADPSYDASTASNYANNDIVLNPKAGTVKDNWIAIVRMVVSHFDALEVNDNEVNYLRTSWVVDNFESFTIRTRLVVRLTNENPQQFSFKIISERAVGQQSVRADELYRPWDRILKRYNSFIDEIQSRVSRM